MLFEATTYPSVTFPIEATRVVTLNKDMAYSLTVTPRQKAT